MLVMEVARPHAVADLQRHGTSLVTSLMAIPKTRSKPEFAMGQMEDPSDERPPWKLAAGTRAALLRDKHRKDEAAAAEKKANSQVLVKSRFGNTTTYSVRGKTAEPMVVLKAVDPNHKR